MSFDRTAKLFGKFEGKVTAKGELQVAETATCQAEIEAGKVLVDGAIEGNVSAQDCIQLNNKARIKGDIKAAKLIVAEGASPLRPLRRGSRCAQSQSSTRSQDRSTTIQATRHPAEITPRSTTVWISAATCAGGFYTHDVFVNRFGCHRLLVSQCEQPCS